MNGGVDEQPHACCGGAANAVIRSGLLFQSSPLSYLEGVLEFPVGLTRPPRPAARRACMGASVDKERMEHLHSLAIVDLSPSERLRRLPLASVILSGSRVSAFLPQQPW